MSQYLDCGAVWFAEDLPPFGNKLQRPETSVPGAGKYFRSHPSEAMYVLPWIQFLYAEGDQDEVHIAFATHDVLIRGAGLQSLLSDVATQRIAQLHEPTRGDQFENGDVPRIREVSVSRIEERH
jgi:hypothetical protein